MNIGELFVSLGFDVDDKKLKEFNTQIKDGLVDMLKLSAAAAGAVYAINAFVEGSVRSATAMRNFNAETGDSVEALQKWQVVSVLKNSAASADQVTASFRAMASSIADVTMGKGNPGTFAMLGISDVRGMDVKDVLEKLRVNFAKNVQTWGLTQTVDLMKSIGFDPAMLQALKLGNDEFEKLANNRILSPETRERLVDLGNAISDFSQQWQQAKSQLSADMAPGLITFLHESVPLLKDFALSMLAVGGVVAKFFSENREALIGISVFFGSLFVALFPVTAVVIGLAAAFWDLGRAIRGLPSYSGDAVNWIKSLGPKISSLVQDNTVAGAFSNSSPVEHLLPSAANQNSALNNSVFLNPTYNINSAVNDGLPIAQAIQRLNQPLMDYAFGSLNRGARY